MTVPKSLSISQLMANVKANIRRLRAEQARQTQAAGPSLPRISPSTIVRMAHDQSKESEYTSRTLDQEIDTVAICTAHNDYMIIGTYSLVKNDENTDYSGQTRRGSLQVMTVSSTFRPKYAGMLPPQLDRVDFSCAVLDIHFHPADSTLLGVATSNASVHFFRFIVHGDVLGRRVTTKLLPLGSVRVAEDDEHGLTPLVTQFTWFPETRTHGIKGVDDVIDVQFAAATTFGEVKIVKVSMPVIRDMFDERVERGWEPLVVNLNEFVHKHDLEAWTVAAMDLRSFSEHESSNHHMILSGGDDSALIASTVDLMSTSRSPSVSSSDVPTINSIPCWKDRRSHTAGIVSILPLTPLSIVTDKGPENTSDLIPLLTGSYDEFIRLFEVDAKTYRATLKTELRLNGGVWRLKILDEYTTGKEEKGKRQRHTLILASLMHAGAAILRLTYTPSTSGSTEKSWTIAPITAFNAGHESMVYCCDARLENGSENGEPNNTTRTGQEGGEIVGAKLPPTYTIVSTSFYDMKICTWKFVDEFKAQNE